MPHSSAGEITLLLSALPENPAAEAELMPIVYETLRRMAATQFSRERPGHTLGPTALVHEAYLRLMKSMEPGRWENRAHFFGAAAVAMRRILIEHARRHRARKRSGSMLRIDLDEALAYESGRSDELLALDEALRRLERLDARQSRIVELRFFGGLSLRETAEALGLGTTTVKTEWAMAKAWLRRELEKDKP